jgi:hypothetical protein
MPPAPTWLLPTLVTSASDAGADAADRSIIFAIAASILALIVVLLILLQLAAIRRRGFKPRGPDGEDTEPAVDPWMESARRISTDESDTDQS